MIQRSITVLQSLSNEVVKIAKWPFNPTNGKGQYVTPSNRHYITGKANLVVTVGYRLGQAGVNLIKTLIFDVLAPLFDAIMGIASDLYHSNPNYSRMAFRGTLSAVQTTFSIAVTSLKLAVGLFRK